MLRLTLAALALALPAGEALARQHETAVPGAIAGRSPHAAYRPVKTAALADACGTTAAASGPSGRLATHVAPARPDPRCATVRMADREETLTSGRD